MSSVFLTKRQTKGNVLTKEKVQDIQEWLHQSSQTALHKKWSLQPQD
jgi:hypothetical protein